MAAPVANFRMSPNLLAVNFIDSSSNVPTSWSWNFGDAGTSTSQNPSHTYVAPGTYTVVLTATNGDGVSMKSRTIRVDSVPVLPLSLYEFAMCKLGPIEIDSACLETYIAQWQMYIQPLVSPSVSTNDTFNELAYPALASALLASLAAYSALIDIANSKAFTSSGATAAGTGTLKKLVTGPAEAEWFTSDESLKLLFKAADGVLSTLSKEICSLAHRLNVPLGMCPPLPSPKILPIKAGRVVTTHTSIWGGFPFDTALTI